MTERITSRKIRKDLRRMKLIIKEWMQGLDFSSFEEAEPDKRTEIYPYDRSTSDLVLAILNQIPPSPSDSFLDIGCGKGYVLALVKKHFCFSRVDGIEIFPNLCQIARSNMAKLGLDSEIINARAEDFDEYDRYNYFYMFNPCVPPLVHRIAQAVAASLCRVPRTAYLLYCHPECTVSWEAFAESFEQTMGVTDDGYSVRLICYKLSPEKAADMELSGAFPVGEIIANEK